MTRALAALTALLITLFTAADAIADTPRAAALIQEANAAYADASRRLSSDHDAAIAGFKRSAALYKSAGPELGENISGRLMYNIGNASMLAGDLGEAVLWFKRAERLLPNDAAVRANLAAARDKVGGAPSRNDSLLHQLTLLEFIPAPARFWTACVALIVMWGLAIARMLTIGGSGWRPTRLSIAGCAVVAIIAGASLVPRELRLREAQQAVLLTESTGRAGPDAGAYEAKPVSPINAGVELRVIEERGDWLLVELADGTRTWLEGKNVQRVTWLKARQSA